MDVLSLGEMVLRNIKPNIEGNITYSTDVELGELCKCLDVLPLGTFNDTKVSESFE